MNKCIKPADLLKKYYADNPEALELLLEHSRRVTKRAVNIAQNLQKTEPVDVQFVAEAAMLHDIGIFLTATPSLHCHGEGPYLCHGIKGKTILEQEGLPKHARVCERHIGVGLSAREIIDQKLPLPARDMQPETLEEQIICYADLFYSKDKSKRHKTKSPQQVMKTLKKFGAEKPAIFLRWVQKFEPELMP